MEIIYMGRRCGKTTRAIKAAAEHFAYIVCMNMDNCTAVFNQAKEMGLDIPFPITMREFVSGEYAGKGVKGFVIDNADMLLQSISKVPIRAITINMEDKKP